ncbi:MAG: thioredoxin domain-containing protein [Sulfurovum sp.]|nr:thioredoxin domain-containing protein [Sulfurovum sp.]
MANHLQDEYSPYLQQHANNPVHWYPWGEEAFSKARQENKAIFLSIGYSSCHWCHVMEEESFEDEATAEILNQHFIAIKVDREERPDIDKHFQEVYQLMNQRAGGWPTSIFLTQEQKPFLFCILYS